MRMSPVLDAGLGRRTPSHSSRGSTPVNCSGTLADTTIDYFAFWEDMACKAGPLISPAKVMRLTVPRYRQVTDLLCVAKEVVRPRRWCAP